MGIQEMSTFIYEYNYYKRGVREQKLNLSNTYKNKLIKLIQENYRPEKENINTNFFMIIALPEFVILYLFL